MYAYIKGVLADVEEESVVVEAGGIGYRIYTTGQTFDYLPAVGEEVKLYTYLNVREDAMILYGFLTKDDLRVFKLLIGVNGIGPKGALAVLSVMTTGIGAKTAQRVILELKDKLSLEEAFELKSEHVSRQNENGSSGVKNEAVQALVALGYASSEALKALNGIEITDDMDVETLLKAALKNMAFL